MIPQQLKFYTFFYSSKIVCVPTWASLLRKSYSLRQHSYFLEMCNAALCPDSKLYLPLIENSFTKNALLHEMKI